MKQKKIFTLLELLVVVAIISILLSFLIPALAKSREIAREAVCASNMKQMYSGACLYSTDNNMFYPAINAPLSMYENRSVHDGIAPYIMEIKNNSGHFPALLQSHDKAGVFTCPSFDETEAVARGMNDWDPRAYYSGYTTNPYMLNSYSYQTGLWYGRPRHMAQLPTGMILHTEGQATGTSSLYFDDKNGLYQYHGDKNKSNYIYVDGHVKGSKINHLLNYNVEPWLNTNNPTFD